MKIDELDESQGLTTEMVREWLTAQNATFRNGHWTHPNGKYRYKDGKYGGLLWSLTLSQIAADFGKANEQALLREINPRMRKGMPSEAAINACPFWLVRDSETHEIELHLARKGRLYALCDCAEKLGGRVVVDVLQGIVMEWERLSPLHLKDFGDVMQFWPCDKHGNKVRWPTDAEGKML